MKKNLSLTLGLLLTSTQVLAVNGRILVSDIDDTIKVSHVLDTDSVIANIKEVNNSFMGMPELYQAVVNEKKVDKVVYLSSAPNLLMKKLHEKFIEKSNFPKGDLLLSQGISNRNHKISALRTIIKEQSPSELILVGDNGERDAEIYRAIQDEYPDLKMSMFIHQAYSSIGYRGNVGKPLLKDQIGYATSIDLASHFLDNNFISFESYEELVNKVVPVALVESNYVKRGKPMMFPAWFDCRDYVSTKLPTTEKVSELVLKFEKRLDDRCDRAPYSN